jgi:hypothetical protein
MSLKLFLFPLQAVVFDPGAGQIALALIAVALFAALVAGRNHAEETLGGINGVRPYGNKTFE